MMYQPVPGPSAAYCPFMWQRIIQHAKETVKQKAETAYKMTAAVRLPFWPRDGCATGDMVAGCGAIGFCGGCIRAPFPRVCSILELFEISIRFNSSGMRSL